MTPARVRACSRLASRAMKPGASASWRSNTLRFTMMIVSIVAADWAVRRSGGRAVSKPSTTPTVCPPDRQTALFDQVNALVQRIGDVPPGVVPFRKIQRRVDPSGNLPQAAGRHQKRAPHRVRLKGAAQTRDGRERGNTRLRRAENVRHVL